MNLKTPKLKNILLILEAIIFVPLVSAHLYTNFEQKDKLLNNAETEIQNFIHHFGDEQTKLINQTRQFLKVISEVPSVRNLNVMECNKFLQGIHKNNSQYSTIVAVDSRGFIRCCAIPLIKTINVRDRSWFMRIKKDKRFIIDNFIISRSSKKASLPFALPVLDRNGKLSSAIGAAFDLEYYKNFFTGIHLPDDSSITITDRTGRLLYQSSGEKINPGIHISEFKNFDIPKGMAGKFSVSEKNGTNRLYWYEKLSIGLKENQICIFIGVSEKSLFATVERTFWNNTLLLAIVFTLSLIFSWLFGKYLLIRPIGNLLYRTHQIKDGNLNLQSAEKNMPLEFHHLFMSFEDMVKRLHHREDEIDTARRLHENLKNYMKNIIDSMPSEIIVVKKNLEISLLNKIAEVNNNITSELSIGKKIDQIIPGLSYITDFVNEVTETERIIIRERQESIVNGKKRYKDITIFPLKEGNDTDAIIRIDDISERVKLQEQLLHSQKMDAIGQLTGGIAHDFNNILAGMYGSTELLKHFIAPDPKTSKYLSLIETSIERAKNLISNLMSFSRNETENYCLINIHDIISNTILLLENTIDKRISISTELNAEFSTVIGDGSQLQTVFLNMGINASHAISGTGEISFTTFFENIDANFCAAHSCEMKPGPYVLIKVSDNGSGISPEILDKIFDPFFTTKERGKGTGLGLSQVYGIIKQMKGVINVYSDQGSGTSFNIYLPVAQGEAKAISYNTVKPRTGSGTILLVEDEETIRITTKSLLQSLGYEVMTAENGMEGVKIFTENKENIDMVLLDMIMPVMSGVDCFKKIRSIMPDIPIIVSSGFSYKAELEELNKIGLNAFLHKPYNIVRLSHTIAEILEIKTPEE